MKYKLALLVPIMGLALACTSLKIEPEKLEKVKTVAIIGFSIEQMQPNDTGSIFKALTNQKSTDLGPSLSGREEAPYVADLYNTLAANLSEKKFKVIPMKTIVSNPIYSKLFKDRTEGMQNRPIERKNYKTFQAVGVLDKFDIYKTTPEELKQLQEALHVDAVVIASATVDLNLNSSFAALVGQGEFHPSATVQFEMKDMRTAEDIWFDKNAKGEKVEMGEKTFLGLADQDKLIKASIKAVMNGYQTVFAHLSEKANR